MRAREWCRKQRIKKEEDIIRKVWHTWMHCQWTDGSFSLGRFHQTLFAKQKHARHTVFGEKFAIQFHQHSVTLNQARTVLKFAKICSLFAKSVCRSLNAMRLKKLLILFAPTNVDEIDPLSRRKHGSLYLEWEKWNNAKMKERIKNDPEWRSDVLISNQRFLNLLSSSFSLLVPKKYNSHPFQLK